MSVNSPTSFFLSKIVFPLYHELKRDSLWKIINEYDKSQWYSVNQLKAQQRNKLEKLLLHAEKNVPYYRRIFRDYGLTAKELCTHRNFNKLPCLTKDIINKSKDSIVASSVKKKDLVAKA